MAEEAAVTATPRVEAERQRGLATFSSLRYRNYRNLWFAQIFRSAAMWMEQIARPVLILQLTDSELLLGLVVAVRMTPQLLFGLVSGVAADRFERKRILLLAQLTVMSLHLTTAVLVLTGVIEAWHVFVLAFGTGSAMVFNQTARQSIIPQIVPSDAVLNAVALNTAALNVMRIAGPGLAAILLLIGNDPGPVYLVAGILGALAVGGISLVEIPRQPREVEKGTSWLNDLRLGLSFVARKPEILSVIAPPLIMFVFGMPYVSVFLPLFAKRVLGLGNPGVGVLIMTTGVGAMIGSLTLASQTGLRRRGPLLLALLALFSIGLMLFSRSTILPLSIVLLIATASMSTSYMVLTNSMLLELSPDQMRGRVLSVMSLDRGLVPVGATIAGALAGSLGPQDGLLVMGAVCLGLVTIAAVAAPPLRRL